MTYSINLHFKPVLGKNAFSRTTICFQLLCFCHSVCLSSHILLLRNNSDLILHTQMEDKERKTPIDFEVKRSKVKLTNSATRCCTAITKKVVNYQTWYFIHRWEVEDKGWKTPIASGVKRSFCVTCPSVTLW